MKITVSYFGKKLYSKDLTIEDLIRGYAETLTGYESNSFMDGHIDAMRPVEEFVNDAYTCIVNGYECEVSDDDLGVFPYVFPDAVRFETAEKIKGIIRDVYECEYMED